MADQKISQLPSGAPAQAGDEYVVARSGANYKLTLTNIAASMPPIGATTPNTGAFTTLTNGLGAVGTPSYTFTGDANTGMWSPTADTVAWSTGGSERMRIDSSGNVGIGTSNPGDRLDVVGGNIRIASGNTVRWVDAGNIRASIQGDSSSNAIFSTAGSERMRIDSSGNVGIGTTANTLAGSVYKTIISYAGGGILGLNNSNNTNQSWGILVGDSGAGGAGRFNLVQNVNGSTSGIGGGPAVPIISADVPTTANTTSRISIAADGVVSDQYGKIRAIPQSGSDKTTSYTLATTDVGRFIGVGSGGSITVPDATFATGDVVSIFNNTTGNVTLTMTITTAYIGGTNTDKATITLATRGVATILFISGTVCVVNGNVS